MSSADVDRLLDLAADYGAEVVDRWGRSAATLLGSIDIDRLADVADLPNFSVQLLFGDDDRPLTLSRNTPDLGEVADLRGFAANERESAELGAARSPVDVARLFADRLGGAFIEYARPGWARTSAAFLDAARSDWTEVARDLSAGSALIAGYAVQTVRVPSPNPPGALPAFTVEGETGVPEVDTAVAALADAAAWTQLAVASSTSAGDVVLALHHDQDPVVRVDLTRVAGGLELLLWRMADDDASRDEAVRYVFRLVTVSSGALPDAKTVRRLAERQRIALTRDRAAEVFRAIADGQRITAESLEASSTSFSNLVENTTTNASATVVGVVALVALLADKVGILPSWLVVAAAAAAVAGVVALIVARCRRIDDAKRALGRLLERLRDDPLLPPDERGALIKAVEDFNIAGRAKNTQRAVVGIGSAACVVAISAAGWLVLRVDTSNKMPPSGTTTTSSTTAAPTTVPSSLPTSPTSGSPPGP